MYVRALEIVPLTRNWSTTVQNATRNGPNRLGQTPVARRRPEISSAEVGAKTSRTKSGTRYESLPPTRGRSVRFVLSSELEVSFPVPDLGTIESSNALERGPWLSLQHSKIVQSLVHSVSNSSGGKNQRNSDKSRALSSDAVGEQSCHERRELVLRNEREPTERERERERASGPPRFRRSETIARARARPRKIRTRKIRTRRGASRAGRRGVEDFVVGGEQDRAARDSRKKKTRDKRECERKNLCAKSRSLSLSRASRRRESATRDAVRVSRE